jgi:hypothetical protein
MWLAVHRALAPRAHIQNPAPNPACGRPRLRMHDVVIHCTYHPMNVATTTPSIRDHSITGSVHRFGQDGVLYEVLREVDDRSALIRVIETGEETTYPITDIQADPTE